RIAKEGARALTGNKLRTFFMMLGTVIGIVALSVIMAIGKGTEKNVMKRVNSFGTHAIMITAGGGKGFSPPQAGITTLRLEDAEAIRNHIKGIAVVAPFVRRASMPIKAGSVQVQAGIMAGGSEWHDAWDWYTGEGEIITSEDVATLARVCLLGSKLAKDLFGNETPVGQSVQIGNVRFRIKGVLLPRGVSPMGDSFDDRLFIPLTTGLRRLLNQEYITNIRVKVNDTYQLDRIAGEIRQLLHERHHITPPEEDDFAVFSAAEVARNARGISGTLTILLSALAGLSLIVGGIVLMNILLISLAERKKEIGLRRALGATQRDIFTQFLMESLTVTVSGMIAGSLAGFVINLTLGRFTKLPLVVSWEPFAMGLVFALVVGVFFGVQPARRAARLNPTEALR
ncbi:MAG: ABC transporter permease, partial [Candidatus Kaiserbacteria bacterium]|nr:ABC transporter permease [Candidatus Kaiserbacteria bacterium]